MKITTGGRGSTPLVRAAEGAILRAMAPPSRPTPQVVRLSAEDEADLRAGLAELDRGEGVELTTDELRRLAETGEWPERLDCCGATSSADVARLSGSASHAGSRPR